MTDYHDFTNIDTPAAERKKLDVGNIYINAIECSECGQEIRSTNRHHMVYCECGKVAIDGGSWYGKISGGEKGWINRTVPFNDVAEI